MKESIELPKIETSAPERVRFTPEQKEMLRQLERERREALDQLAELEQIKDLDRQIKPEDRSLPDRFYEDHGPHLSHELWETLRNGLGAGKQTFMIAPKVILALEQINILENQIREEAGQDQAERDLRSQARLHHLEVMKKEWKMN
jgi:hypothetical protein